MRRARKFPGSPNMKAARPGIGHSNHAHINVGGGTTDAHHGLGHHGHSHAGPPKSLDRGRRRMGRKASLSHLLKGTHKGRKTPQQGS